MSYHARISVLVHYVFSTKRRIPLIPLAMQRRLLNQDKHHANRTFAHEWKMFLKRHRLVEYQYADEE